MSIVLHLAFCVFISRSFDPIDWYSWAVLGLYPWSQWCHLQHYFPVSVLSQDPTVHLVVGFFRPEIVPYPFFETRLGDLASSLEGSPVWVPGLVPQGQILRTLLDFFTVQLRYFHLRLICTLWGYSPRLYSSSDSCLFNSLLLYSSDFPFLPVIFVSKDSWTHFLVSGL